MLSVSGGFDPWPPLTFPLHLLCLWPIARHLITYSISTKLSEWNKATKGRTFIRSTQRVQVSFNPHVFTLLTLLGDNWGKLVPKSNHFFLWYTAPLQKISSKSVHNFSSKPNPAYKQKKKQCQYNIYVITWRWLCTVWWQYLSFFAGFNLINTGVVNYLIILTECTKKAKKSKNLQHPPQTLPIGEGDEQYRYIRWTARLSPDSWRWQTVNIVELA